jgi:hypothetical protein
MIIKGHSLAVLIRHKERIEETLQHIAEYNDRTVNALRGSMEKDLKEINQAIEILTK